MKIKLYRPIGLHQIGSRSNNEDNLYPQIEDVDHKSNLFLVCDGVGGSAKGEVASRLVCEAIPEYFERYNDAYVDSGFINNAVKYSQQAIDDYLQERESAQGMATTLTLLNFNTEGAVIAHIGDSRVYHIRGNEILFQTSDHSLVNELLKSGVLTPEQAANHPQKNVITRAIEGSNRKVEAEVHLCDDIEENDYFFLCSDGILEQIDNYTLLEVLNRDIILEEKIEAINEICYNSTKDNYTCYLLQVESVEYDDRVPCKGLRFDKSQKKNILNNTTEKSKRRIHRNYLFIIIVLLLVIYGQYYVANNEIGWISSEDIESTEGNKSNASEEPKIKNDSTRNGIRSNMDSIKIKSDDI